MIALPKILTPDSPQFPPVSDALTDPNGLLAIGGDLTAERLIEAYEHGIFPWFNPGEPILWWSPDPRAVLFPEQLKISRSLRKVINKQDYHCQLDTAFIAVINACATIKRNYANGTWLTETMMEAYCELHQLGLAHSIEVFDVNNNLVGGLYGVVSGRVFSGESMFHYQPDTAKIALVFLCEQLASLHCDIIDCQIMNPFLDQMGATMISRNRFLGYLR